MLNQTRYNIPAALGGDLYMAFFWAVLAPILCLYGAAELGTVLRGLVLPEGAPAPAHYQINWAIHALGLTLWIAGLSFWSEAIGATPFAGSLHVPTHSLALTLMAGPLILFLPSLAMDFLMADEGWAYREPVSQAAFNPANWSLSFLISLILLAPIAEEIAFRGVLLGALIARGVTPLLAMILSSGAFALIHFQYTLAGMGVVFLSGMGFALLRLYSGSLTTPILAHAAGNMFVLWGNWLIYTQTSVT